MAKSYAKLKTAIAILLLFPTFLVMWLFTGVMIGSAVFYFADLSLGSGDARLMMILALRLIGPAFGGFFAIWFPKYILKSVNLRVLYISFLAVVTLFGMLWILGRILVADISGWESALFAAQYVAIVSGAYVARAPLAWKARLRGWGRRPFILDFESQKEE